MNANNSHPAPRRGRALVFGLLAVIVILGAVLVGPEVTELLPELTLAQMMELTPNEISRNVHAHPSLSETLMEAAHAAEGHSINI